MLEKSVRESDGSFIRKFLQPVERLHMLQLEAGSTCIQVEKHTGVHAFQGVYIRPPVSLFKYSTHFPIVKLRPAGKCL